MNWTLLLSVFGPTSAPACPMLAHLAQSSTHCVLSDPKVGHQPYETVDGQLMEQHVMAPEGFALFADTAPDNVDVPAKGTSYFQFMTGQLADGKPSRTLLNRFLNLNGSQQGETPYVQWLRTQVFEGLQGKYSTLIAQLGHHPAFVFANRKLGLHMWLVSYRGIFYLLASNDEQRGPALEAHIQSVKSEHALSYYMRPIALPSESLLVLKPDYFVGKLRTRSRTVSNMAQRGLHLSNYSSTYLSKRALPF